MTALSLAWRQLRRDLAAGEVRILLAALALAVLAITAVGFVTERAERALVLQANQLLGGDAVVRSRAPITGPILEAAGAPGLRSSETREFNTMVRVGDDDAARLQLGDLRALGDGYPLRGAYVIAGSDGVERNATGIPATGTAWLSRAGAETLDARIGDREKDGVVFNRYVRAPGSIRPDLAWHTDARNERSQRAIERLGAIREGVLRSHRVRPDGTLRDTSDVMSALMPSLFSFDAESVPSVKRARCPTTAGIGLAFMA